LFVGVRSASVVAFISAMAATTASFWSCMVAANFLNLLMSLRKSSFLRFRASTRDCRKERKTQRHVSARIASNAHKADSQTYRSVLDLLDFLGESLDRVAQVLNVRDHHLSPRLCIRRDERKRGLLDQLMTWALREEEEEV
jgi:hypothetical protein